MDLTTFQSCVDALASKLAASGHYIGVNAHEPEANVQSGLTAGVWLQRIRPAEGSGLASTNMLMVFAVRLYGSADAEPSDLVDPALLAAANDLWSSIFGDFDLSGPTGTAPVDVQSVDLQGINGIVPELVTQFLFGSDGTGRRIITITIPVIVNDAYTHGR